MEFDIEQEIKLNLIIAFIVSIIYGLWFLISVESWVAMVNWPYLDPFAGKTIGSIYTALAIILLKAFKERDEWEKIENTLLFLAITSILGIIISIFGMVAYNLPAVAIVNLIIYLVLTILNIHIYIKKRK